MKFVCMNNGEHKTDDKDKPKPDRFANRKKP